MMWGHSPHDTKIMFMGTLLMLRIIGDKDRRNINEMIMLQNQERISGAHNTMVGHYKKKK